MGCKGKGSVGGACLALLAASPAFAEGLTANGQFTTDYVPRGISQTATRPAVQGGLDYDTGIGITLGTWVSSLDFGGAVLRRDFRLQISLGIFGSGPRP